MKNTDDYPELGQLFGVYLNQDYEYWGSSLEEVIACYVRDSTHENAAKLLIEIDEFSSSHANDLDESFNRHYGFDFAPSLWGHTTASFFAELKMLLLRAIGGAS